MAEASQTEKRILPGATIGMVGSGQLGRMFAHAATAMGYQVVVFAGAESDPASQVTGETVVGDLADLDAIAQFAEQCDVITLEFENIPWKSIERCSQSAPTYPSAEVLATAQNRLLEKNSLASAGLPVAPYASVLSPEDVANFADFNGWPVILKTAEAGYDGKGQYRLESASDAEAVPWSSADQWVAEKCIAFEREASVMVARSSVGEVRCFEPFENDHRNHILDVTRLPGRLSERQREIALDIATRTAEALDVIGLVCVELFVVDEETVLINEIAPRPHNSGHLTIEACRTSQFEQHVRAVCGLPLGDPSIRVGGAAMANLLGDLWADGPPDWSKALSVPGVSLHLYGKAAAKPGRKMGHLTATAQTVEQAVAAVCEARDRLSS